MTTTQHTSINTDSLPVAVRRLEAARPGDLAHAPGGSPCAMKMESDSGTPWLLDPWGHTGAPSRVTTAAIAQMGYRAETELPTYESDVEPTSEAALAHLNMLYADGWAPKEIARATGLAVHGIRRTHRLQRPVRRATAEKILSVDPDAPMERAEPSGAERMEDMEFLLDLGVPSHQVVERCGYASLDSATWSARTAGRPDLADRLLDREPDDRPATPLDDYDPYTDPDFEEQA